MSKNKKTVILLLIAAVLIAVVPLFVLKEAEFGGSDDAGSVMVEEIHGEYEPWFTPVLETALRQRTARRDRKSYFLYSDRDRRGNHRIYNGTVRGT